MVKIGSFLTSPIESFHYTVIRVFDPKIAKLGKVLRNVCSHLRLNIDLLPGRLSHVYFHSIVTYAWLSIPLNSGGMFDLCIGVAKNVEQHSPVSIELQLFSLVRPLT